MSKFDFVEHMSNISSNLMSRYKLAEAYQHKGGKGEIREAILTDWLRELLPDTVSVTKGEIVDSDQRRSREFDIIIYLNSPMPKIFSSQEKRVIPAETVLAVIEVKSKLKKNDIETFSKSIAELNKFTRYFRSTELGKYLCKITGTKSFPEKPILVMNGERGIGSVIGGLFTFEAPNQKTVQQYFTKTDIPRNFLWVYVLESCFYFHNCLEKKWHATSTQGKQSILLFVVQLLEICKDSQRFTHVEPNFNRYIDIAVQSVKNKDSSG